ncbi:WD40 repeat domain-containing protein [Kaarinaea lacus]
MPGIAIHGATNQDVAANVAPSGSPRLWSAMDCIRDISGSPESNHVAVADASGAVSVLDSESKALMWSKFAHELGASLIDWCASADVIASAGQDGYIKLWQPQTGEVVKVLQIQGPWVEQLKWSPDGNYLAAAAGKSVLVWDRQGKEVINFTGHQSTVTSIAWKYNSKEVATACYKGVNLFRVGFSRPYQALHCLGSLISLAWSPDGKAICAGSQDRMLQYWRLTNNKNHHAEMKGYPEKVSVLEWDKSSRYLASSGSNDVVVWTTHGKSPAGTAPNVFKGHGGRVTALGFQNKGQILASGANDGSIYVWDVSKNSEFIAKWNIESPVTRLFWVNDDSRLVVGAKDGSINLFGLSGKKNLN